MAEFTFTADSDFSRVFADMAKVGQEAKRAGDQLGKGLSDGLSTANANIKALQSQILTLVGARAQLKVDSSEFKTAQAQIDLLQGKLQQALGQRLKLQVDATALKSAAADIKDLGQVGAGSADGFRLLDGVVQGVAFSLSNSVVSGAGQALQALQGLITGYAQLDTVIRQAAAASGGPDDYAKLAGIIEKVGIDAAGTSDQVAALSLELARGGLTADQQTDSLAGIVRGAEATATAYERMGEIVSATLTSFGLDASETTRVVDALVQGANTSATDVSGLGEAFKTAAPAAKLLGVSVEGLATAVGLFTNAGITAGETGTTLRNGLSLLASAAPKAGQPLQGLTGQAKMAADAVKRLGLDIYTSTGQLKPMGDVLLQLKRAFDGLTAGERIQLASSLFGGIDDATKWLAVLEQSPEKIKKAADAMANSAGATDRNRDAMQGFQLTLQQLTGTLDNLGKNVGKVAAAGLLPLVQAANGIVGVVSGLPSPVKDTAIALTLLTGSVVGATAAYVIFKRVLAIGAVSDTISEIAQLSAGIGGTLKAGINAAVAAWPAFIAQAKLASTAQFTLVGSLQATAAALKAQFIAGLNGAKAGLAAFVAALKSATFATFISGAKAAIVALAPLALALAGIVVAVAAWREVLASSDAVQEKFAGSQKQASDALGTLKKSLGEAGNALTDTKNKAEDTRNIFEKLLSRPREDMGMREITMQTLKQIEAWEGVSVAINKYIAANRNARNLGGESATQAVAYVKAAQAAADANMKRAASLREYADSAEAAGRFDEAAQARNSADTLDRVANSYRNQAAALQAKLDPLAKEVTLTKEQKQAIDARRAAEEALNNVLAEAPTRKLESQIAVGQQLLSLAQAIGQAEQSRFAIGRSALEFELQQAEKRGASEGTIGAIKKRIADNDKAALAARYQALLKEQDLQLSMLRLEQRKASAQASTGILQQLSAIAKANRELEKAKAEFGGGSDQAAQAQAELQTQQQILGYKREEQSILGQTQPLELAALGYRQEAARNGLQAEAAAKGYAFALNGTLQPANALVELQGRISTVTQASAADQARYTELAQQSGLAIGRAADGSLVLGRTQADVNKAVAEMNRQLTGAKGNYDGAAKGAEQAKGQTDLLKKALNESAKPAGDVATAFSKVGTSAPVAVQGARDFAGWISKAKGFTDDIDRIRLDSRMAAVRDRTNEAARAAEAFYNSLLKSSSLPGSRWSGGPVEAGGEYKINELGQEAFLSAGRLSLINAPANSIWRAPSSGVVIPAGVTARLRERGQLAVAAGSGQAPGMAELAIEVGKLRTEVGNLARRDWSVHVQQRTGPTGSQVMKTLLR